MEIVKVWQPLATDTKAQTCPHLALRSLFTASGSLSRSPVTKTRHKAIQPFQCLISGLLDNDAEPSRIP